jgi:hypothetical protein
VSEQEGRRAQGSGLRAQAGRHGSGLRAQGSGLRAQGSGLRAQGSGGQAWLRAQGSGLRAQGSGLRAQAGRCRVRISCMIAPRSKTAVAMWNNKNRGRLYPLPLPCDNLTRNDHLMRVDRS